jgi:hypothetical protein
MMQKTVKILLILGMLAAVCGTVSAGVGIIAETQTLEVGAPPVCTAPCECISESEAAQRWGAEGYDRCSKTICGQSANANVPYYCFHQVGGSTSASLMSCQAPCECMAESGAIARWGTNGYSQCSQTLCGQDATSGGSVPRYCYRQWGSTLVIGGGTMTQTTVTTGITLGTVQAPAQTQVQAPIATAATANPSPSYSWPTPAPIQTKTPVGIATILAAIGIILLAVVMMRKE